METVYYSILEYLNICRRQAGVALLIDKAMISKVREWAFVNQIIRTLALEEYGIVSVYTILIGVCRSKKDETVELDTFLSLTEDT